MREDVPLRQRKEREKAVRERERKERERETLFRERELASMVELCGKFSHFSFRLLVRRRRRRRRKNF